MAPPASSLLAQRVRAQYFTLYGKRKNGAKLALYGFGAVALGRCCSQCFPSDGDISLPLVGAAF